MIRSRPVLTRLRPLVLKSNATQSILVCMACLCIEQMGANYKGQARSRQPAGTRTGNRRWQLAYHSRRASGARAVSAVGFELLRSRSDKTDYPTLAAGSGCGSLERKPVSYCAGGPAGAAPLLRKDGVRLRLTCCKCRYAASLPQFTPLCETGREGNKKCFLPVSIVMVFVAGGSGWLSVVRPL